MDILALILSIIGTICICTTSLVRGKSMKIILLLLFTANLLLGISYLITNSISGAVTCLLGAAQTIINYFFDKRDKRLPLWLVITYALSFIVVNLIVFKHIYDVITILASLVFVMCITRKSGKSYRLWSLLNMILWVSYDLISGSYGPLVTHVIKLPIIVFGIVMYDIVKSEKNKEVKAK